MYRSILSSTIFTKQPFYSIQKASFSFFNRASYEQISTNTHNNAQFSTATTATQRPKTENKNEIILQPHHFAKYKMPPSYVSKRLARLKSYIGNARKIRHSPWKMNRICQFAATTKTVPEALIQLQFLQKRYAINLHKAIKRSSNFADIKDGIQPSQLEVAECFATCAFRRKGITYHGKGKSGKRTTRFSHIRLVLREIDFDLKILQSTSQNQKRVWIELKEAAEYDAKMAAEENQLLRKHEEREKLKKEVEFD